MADQQFLMLLAQICQTLAVVSSSPGQLSLTTVVRFPDVLQSGFEECPKGCSCRCLACTICVLLEVMGQGWGLVGPTPLPCNSLLGTGLVVQQVGTTGSLKQFSKPQPGLGPPTQHGAILPITHCQALDTVLQPDGVFLIQLLELQL